MKHDGQSPEPAPVRLQIELQPETATRRWHAVVRTADGRTAFESDSPLELVRHLAQWSRQDHRPHGLR
jgi:hypothetical protein